MKINIHTITFNRLDMTKVMFESALKTITIPYTHVFFNNFYSKEDKTPEYLKELEKKYKFVKGMYSPKNIGIGKAANACVAYTPDYDYYIQLDNDVKLETIGWLEKMIAISKSYDDNIILTGELKGIDHKYIHKEWSQYGELKLGFTTHIGGAWHFAPAKILRNIGYLSEVGLRGPKGGTDSDFSRRVVIKRYKQAVVYGLEASLQISEQEEKIKNKDYWIKSHQEKEKR